MYARLDYHMDIKYSMSDLSIVVFAKSTKLECADPHVFRDLYYYAQLYHQSILLAYPDILDIFKQ